MLRSHDCRLTAAQGQADGTLLGRLAVVPEIPPDEQIANIT